MYSTNVYIYEQKQQVLLLNRDELYEIRWRPVYTKNLRASKGVDNTIQFKFMNQDQKPVDVTGLSFVFRMIDRKGEKLLLTKTLEVTEPLKGRARLTLLSTELDPIHTQLANYSVTVDDTLDTPVFVDDNAGSRGVIAIEDASFPKFIPSKEISLPPSMPVGSARNWDEYDQNVATASSQWVPAESFQTVQYWIDQFEGDIKIQAADPNVNNNTWFDIETVNYPAPTSGTYYVNIDGWYPRMRITIDPVAGKVTRALVR